MATRVSTTLCIDVMTHGGEARRRHFERPIVTVGKLSTCALTLDDAEVSRRHCVIELAADGRWRITDLGSTHGTFVNDRSTVQRWLEDGDIISLGKTTLRVLLAGDGQEASQDDEDPGAPPFAAAQTMFRDDTRLCDSPLEGRPYVHVSLMRGDTLLSADRFEPNNAVRVGETRDCQLLVPQSTLGTDQAVLVQSTPSGPYLNTAIPGLSGEALYGDELVALETSEGQWLPLKTGMRARLSGGDYTLLVSYTHDERYPRRGPWSGINFTPLNFMVGSAIVHLLFLWIGAIMPEDPLRSMRDPMHQRQRLVSVIKITEPQALKETLKEDDATANLAEPSESTSARDLPSIDEATTATERLVHTLRRHQKHQRRDATLSDGLPMNRKAARTIATRTGVHAALGEHRSLLSRVMQSARFDPTEVAWLGRGGGPEEGALVSDVFGPNGPGSGPADWMGLNPNASGPLGPASPLGPQKKRRSRREPSMKKSAAVFADVRAITVSGRDKGTVAKRIRRYLSGIRWCLRDALQNGTVETGKMRLKFAIGPDGLVFGIRVGGAGSKAFKACATRKIRLWRFGGLASGGVTHVSYPVVLKVRD